MERRRFPLFLRERSSSRVIYIIMYNLHQDIGNMVEQFRAIGYLVVAMI